MIIIKNFEITIELKNGVDGDRRNFIGLQQSNHNY